uniref:Uncharacterized protein n=1 Tax=Candidatus Kentrum sp. FW TaxID=2126338 RepID=A0A450TUY5_9GAMM|nr:MAG: hypothetical protein BECKFW1821C_GA0114237_103722 [Candidatus Kentron sp. FW]
MQRQVVTVCDLGVNNSFGKLIWIERRIKCSYFDESETAGFFAQIENLCTARELCHNDQNNQLVILEHLDSLTTKSTRVSNKRFITTKVSKGKLVTNFPAFRLRHNALVAFHNQRLGNYRNVEKKCYNYNTAPCHFEGPYF